MSDDTRIEVLPVTEGSIIWLHNVDFPDGDLGHLVKMLREKIGHDRFLLLSTDGDGVVEVIGEDEVVARVRAALDREPKPIAPWRSVGAGFPEWIDRDGHRYFRSDPEPS